MPLGALDRDVERQRDVVVDRAGRRATLVVGGAVGHFTRRGIVYSALRALVIMALASAVTYGVGHAVGVS